MAIDPYSLYERIIACHASKSAQEVHLKKGDLSIHANFYGREGPQTVQVRMPRATFGRPELLQVMTLYGGDSRFSLFVRERGNVESGFHLERTLFGEPTKCAYKVGAEHWKMTPPMRQTFADTLYQLGINTDPRSFSDVTRCVQQPWTEYYAGIDALLKLYDGLRARPNLGIVLKLDAYRSVSSLFDDSLTVSIRAPQSDSADAPAKNREGFRWLVHDLENKGVDLSGDWTAQ